MSELTKEKIYKKELEKVGGEGNNNLERIRSLGPYATVEYVNTLMSGALKRAIVETLPTENIDTNTIYMVLDSEASQQGNVYNEHLYINNAWELIGTTKMETPHLYRHDFEIKFDDFNRIYGDVYTASGETLTKETLATLVERRHFVITGFIFNTTDNTYTPISAISSYQGELRYYLGEWGTTTNPENWIALPASATIQKDNVMQIF